MDRLRINPVVFFTSAGVSILFVVVVSVFTEQAGAAIAAVQDFIVTRFGWWYILAVTGFLVFVVWLFFSPYGAVRLGRDDDEPEYSYPTWFAMLFSAGMGIGLLFYGVAEPVLHFQNPPFGGGGDIPAAREAMSLTFFHWGLHAWAVYIVVGLSLAYFAYRHDLPLSIRSTLYPLLGERIHGPIGDLVDIMAVFGTLFGIATSLGLGVMQVNAGLDYLGLLAIDTGNQLWLIAGITALATISVATGLDVGVRRLSELNLGIGLVLLLFILVAGPTVFLLSSLVQSIGHYLQQLPDMSLRTTAFLGTEWQASWTMFYWGWWISWSPFVGMFIARISRGRTIRAFIGGVLLVPVLLTFTWFVVFGNTALHMELFGGGGIAAAVSEEVATALYVMLDRLPWPAISSTLATIMVATFFVTSADSGSLVIDILTAEGDTNPPLPQRIFWALSAGVVAAVLLVAGGLSALQTAAITTALPFSVIMVFMCYSLVQGLEEERPTALRRAADAVEAERLAMEAEQTPELVEGAAVPADDWQQRLRAVLSARGPRAPAPPTGDEAEQRLDRYFETTVQPALARIQDELRRHGRIAEVKHARHRAVLTVYYRGTEEFSYAIRGRLYHRARFAFPEQRPQSGGRVPRLEVVLRSGVRDEFDLATLSQEGIIEDFLQAYSKWIGW